MNDYNCVDQPSDVRGKTVITAANKLLVAFVDYSSYRLIKISAWYDFPKS